MQTGVVSIAALIIFYPRGSPSGPHCCFSMLMEMLDPEMELRLRLGREAAELCRRQPALGCPAGSAALLLRAWLTEPNTRNNPESCFGSFREVTLSGTPKK